MKEDHEVTDEEVEEIKAKMSLAVANAAASLDKLIEACDAVQEEEIEDQVGRVMNSVIAAKEYRNSRPAALKLLGFTIDTTSYPWFAYKGPRFRPTESFPCWTPQWSYNDAAKVDRIKDEL